MNDIFLSIIVSCYNSAPFIERLLNSIQENHIPKESYEILIIDDNSTDNFIKLVKPYESILPIKCFNTNTDIHCPGNTRNVGIEKAQGKWITFIDHDDAFESDGLWKVIQILSEHPEIETVLTTNFREYDEDAATPLKEITSLEANGWVHGKFFNRLNFMEKYNLRFKPNTRTHEDIHFINNVNTLIYLNDLCPFHANIFTYKWIFYSNSLSRRTLQDKHTYLDVNMDTYLDAASYVFMDYYNEKLTRIQKDYLKSNMIYGLVYCYFYIQADKFRNNGEFIERNLQLFAECRNAICNLLNISIDDIVNFVKLDVVGYNQVRTSSFIGGGPFIESEPFEEFIKI